MFSAFIKAMSSNTFTEITTNNNQDNNSNTAPNDVSISKSVKFKYLQLNVLRYNN